MNAIIALQRENRELKEQLQDAVELAGKYRPHMGLVDQEELARVTAKVSGTAYKAKDWDVQDRNGEQ